MVDLEYGGNGFSKNIKLLITRYHTNRTKIKYTVFSLLIVTIAVIVKVGFISLNDVVVATNTITLDESPYVPFVWNEEITTYVSDRGVVKYPKKTSSVNWKLQALNIYQFSNHVMGYLEASENICIHCRHFGVPYDILVFKDKVMVSPVVTDESDQMVYSRETSLNGSVTRVKRNEWIEVMYYNMEMEKEVTRLVGNDAICFSHYMY